MLINIRIFLYDRDYNIQAHVCVRVSESEYRPLLPYSEATSQILLSSLNPVDNRKWRRKSWGWRVLKLLKVCVMVDRYKAQYKKSNSENLKLFL